MSVDSSARIPVLIRVACACLLLLAPVAAAESVDSLIARGLRLVDSPDLQQRLKASRDLREASLLAPQRTDVWWGLVRLHEAAHSRDQLRSVLQRLSVLTPEDGRVWAMLGDTWRWDWMANVNDSSYARAVRCYRFAVQRDTTQLGAWLGSCGLALGRGDLRSSRVAAEGAIACAPDSPMSHLAFACTAYRLGSLQLADDAFNEAIPRLPAAFSKRFRGVDTKNWRAVKRDKPPAPDSSVVWDHQRGIPDPDLTTPWNEAELDFRFRVGLALLLLRTDDSLHWDMRSELIARYGMPTQIQEMVGLPDFELALQRRLAVQYAPPPNAFPYHYQRWRYPGFGMDCLITDRSLTEQYESRPNDMESQEPMPDLELLRGRSDFVFSPDGLVVLRTMPPGVSPLPMDVLVARFPSPTGTRLVAYLAASGSPQDTLWGSMVVSDASGTERIAEADGRLRLSMCDPGGRQLVQLAAVVPFGQYRVDLSVRAGKTRRGLDRQRIEIAPPDSSLWIGDLIMLCGAPEFQTSAGAITLDPTFTKVSRDRVSVYFELANLAADAKGQKAFTYSYTIRELDELGNVAGPALVEAARSEEFVGESRRQFITANCSDLRPGHYQMRIQVHDDHAQTTVSRAIEFERAAPQSREDEPAKR